MNNLYERKTGLYQTAYEFGKIDTKEKAYVIGFLSGKGKIEKENRVYFYAAPRDRKIVEFISNTIYANVTRHIYKSKVNRNKIRTTLVLKKLTKDARKFLGDDRDGTKRYPIVNKSLARYELQGIYDAIGQVAWGRRKNGGNQPWQRVNFITKYYDVLVGLQQFLLKELQITSVLRQESGRQYYILEFKNSHDVYKFVRYILDDNDMIVSTHRYLKLKALRLELEEFGETLDN